MTRMLLLAALLSADIWPQFRGPAGAGTADGADLPEPSRSLGPAQQLISLGETYDFVVQPVARGELNDVPTLELQRDQTGRLTWRNMTPPGPDTWWRRPSGS